MKMQGLPESAAISPARGVVGGTAAADTAAASVRSTSISHPPSWSGSNQPNVARGGGGGGGGSGGGGGGEGATSRDVSGGSG